MIASNKGDLENILLFLDTLLTWSKFKST